MEQEARETGAVTRGQNVVYVMPHDWASITRFLEPLIEKIDPGQTDLQVLVITPDADAAAAVAGAAVRLLRDRDVQILAATSSARASRLLKLRPAQIVVGTSDTVVQLMRSASLKLDAVRQICIAWADELLARGDAAPLETLMADVPKDAARSIVVAETSPAVEELLERYARRARRVSSPSAEGTPPTAIEYVATSPSARLNTLRRVLDLADPVSAAVFVREGDSTREVNDLLRSMGYGADDAVRVALVAAPGTALAVLFDLPASREELREAVGAASRAVALVQPRQLASLRALAAGGMVKPLTLPDSMKSAREQDAQVRAQVRAILDDGKFGRALLAMEPLLEDYDGSEVAAAVLTLLEREREAHRTTQTATAGSAQRDPASMVRLFVTVGSRDGARPGDLVGAMANQGGVSSAELGKVDVRESHSVVEVSANVADALIERLNGTTIKGRRALVRRDEPARGGRSDRPDRAARGDRGDRGDRPSRGPGGPPRGGDRPERRPSRGPRREGGRDRE